MTEPFVIRQGRAPEPVFTPPPGAQEDNILYKIAELERRIQLLESQAGTS